MKSRSKRIVVSETKTNQSVQEESKKKPEKLNKNASTVDFIERNKQNIKAYMQSSSNNKSSNFTQNSMERGSKAQAQGK